MPAPLFCLVLPCLVRSCLCLCCPGLSCPAKVILVMLGKAFWYYKYSTFLALIYFKIRLNNHEKSSNNGSEHTKHGPETLPKKPQMSCGKRPFSSLGAKRPARPPQKVPREPQDAPRRSPRGPKTAQEAPGRPPWRRQDGPRGPKTAPRGTKRPPRGPKRAPRRPKTSPKTP